MFAHGDDDDGVDAHIYRHRLIIFIRVYYDRLAALLKLFPTGCGILVLWCQSQTETVGRRFISTVWKVKQRCTHTTVQVLSLCLCVGRRPLTLGRTWRHAAQGTRGLIIKQQTTNILLLFAVEWRRDSETDYTTDIFQWIFHRINFKFSSFFLFLTCIVEWLNWHFYLNKKKKKVREIWKWRNAIVTGGSDLTHIRRYYIAWNRARICCRLLYVLRNSPDGPPLSCQPLYYTFRHRLWTTICIWHGTIVAHGMMILTIFHRRRRLVARCERAKGARPLLLLLTCVIFLSETDSFFDMSIGSISL